ncbi:MAG: hypothetical protein HYW48_10715 [Deltaproteobacteria bacterium]|nr:hypothetical protein [Deltaproteobacteria bacterium]
MKLCRTLVLASLLFPRSLGAETIVIDRMILKINETAFTQREVETYFLVKAVTSADYNLLPNEQTWGKVLTEFKNDILLYEESQKLRHVSPTPQADLDKTMNLLREKTKHGLPGAFAERLALKEQDLLTALQIFLKVEKVRDQKATPIGSHKRSSDGRLAISDLEQKNYVRFFDDAEVYKLIQPNAFSPSQQ